jgi:hypothetical protein
VVVGLDGAGNCCSVAVYHLTDAALAHLTTRDTLTILDPVVKRVGDVSIAATTASAPAAAAGESKAAGSEGAGGYLAVHVTTPSGLLVNGKLTKPVAKRLQVTAFDA